MSNNDKEIFKETNSYFLPPSNSMKALSIVNIHSGLFISTDSQKEFLIYFGKKMGYGRFSLVRPETDFTPNGGLFELAEIHQEREKFPHLEVLELGVLWTLPEALRAHESISAYAQWVGLKP
ncbi:hypothetical protein [Providencia stuartii]|uniref:hypothetical protein n=1 Tax=Providencia stuartii TaxID=588 RepID=UPI0034E4E139